MSLSAGCSSVWVPAARRVLPNHSIEGMSIRQRPSVIHHVKRLDLMSLALLASTVADLPYALREQVIGYAESVKAALPAIYQEAGVAANNGVSDQVVFLAGLRKFHSLVASNYWALDNSASLLEASDISRIRVGAQDLSRGGQLHRSLKNALEALETALAREEIKELLHMPYLELIERLAADGPR